MKIIFSCLLICFAPWVAEAQSNHSALPAKMKNKTIGESPEAMIRQFYIGYITSIANEEPKESEKKLREMLKKYCTQRLIDRVPELTEASDADPFIKAQDSDTKVLQSLSVKKDKTKVNVYLVSYGFGNPMVFTRIQLSLVRRNGSYWIDDVR